MRILEYFNTGLLKTKTLLFVLALIINSTLLIHNSEAQWVRCDLINNGSVISFAESGNNIFAGTRNGGVYLSTNNGQNWTQTALNNQWVSSLAISGENIFAGTINGVFLSTNNGQNWTRNPYFDQDVQSLSISGNNIYAGTHEFSHPGGVFLSTNNGQTWTPTTLNNKYVHTLAISGNNIFAGCIYDQGLYLSTNNGQIWTNMSYLYDVYTLAISGNDIFMGNWGGVYLSTNNGQNWTQTGLNNQYIPSLAISGNNIFAGAYFYTGIYHSTNRGQTWTQINQGFDTIPPVFSFLITNNYIFAGTEGQFIWRRSLSEIIGIQNISTEIPSLFSLSQNYPNPFNPSTKIRFDVIMDSRFRGNDKVVLKVYDVRGREVQTLVNERLQPGTYEATFDGNGLNSGVYFYKLMTNDYTETKRMILLK